LRFEVAKLDESLEDLFYKHTFQDIPNNFFFIFDWKSNREKTDIWLALEQNLIRGMMLVYDGRIVHLRGDKGVAEVLLRELDVSNPELTVEQHHRQLVLEKYLGLREHVLTLMTLRRGEERLYPSDSVVRLKAEHAEEAADLMRSANPEFWGNMNAKRVTDSMARAVWMGIFVDEDLASVGSVTTTDFAALVGIVATREPYRNRGYATSVVSALLGSALKTNDLVLIHVLKDNVPARKVYGKVGFKPFKDYLLFR